MPFTGFLRIVLSFLIPPLLATAVALLPLSWILQRKEIIRNAPAGCKPLLVPKVSALADQHAKKYSKAGPEKTWRIKGLFVYPIKSCKGVEVSEVEIRATGCKYDREFVFAQHASDEAKGDKAKKWRFITLRKFPKLAYINTEIWQPDPSSRGYSPNGLYAQSDGCLVISFPSVLEFDWSWRAFRLWPDQLRGILSRRSLNPWTYTSFRIPYTPTISQIKDLGLSVHDVQIWNDWPTGLNLTPLIPAQVLAELKAFLGISKDFALFRKDPTPRPVLRNALDIPHLGYPATTSFSDSFPINLLNLASTHDLSSRLPPTFGPLSAARFRANFLLTGPPAFAEDHWKSIRLRSPTADLLFHVTNRTTRCSLPNVDPEQRDPRRRNTIKIGDAGAGEPLKTLVGYRCIDEGAPGNACLGMMVVPGEGTLGARVNVGMEVVVGEVGAHRFRA